MKYFIRGNVTITDAIKEYVETKISKVEKYFPNGLDANVHVNVNVHNNSQKIEVTIKTPSDLVFRAEEIKEDLYESIDLVVDKLERQIRKYKTKVNRKHKHTSLYEPTVFGQDEQYEEFDDNEFEIVKQKKFSLKPMHVQEAVMQMEMLGHQFFVYLDAETNQTNIVYARKDNSYGLIET